MAVGGLIAVRVALLVLPFVIYDRELPRVFAADATRYHQIATAPGRPYRDFDVEFPPVSLAAIDLVDGSTPRDTALRLGALELILDIATCGILLLGWGSLAGLAYLAMGTALIPFVYFRLDVLSVALAIGGFLLVRRDHPRLGGIGLSLAVLAKVWPLALVPVLFVERKGRALLWLLGGLLAASLAWIWWGGRDGPIQVLTLRRAHGWQIESLVASVIRVVSDTRVFSEAGADRIGSSPLWVRGILLAAAVGIIALAARLASRRRELAETVYPATALTTLLLAAPVLSPQYLIWLFPWVGIAVAANERIQAELLGFATVLSAAIIYNYSFLVAGRAAFTWMVLLRNLLMVVAVGAGLWRLAGHRLEMEPSHPLSARESPVV